MSKVSYVLIAVMGAALIYMGAVRWHQRQERKQAAQEAAAMQDGEPFSFQHIPVSLAAAQAEFQQEPIPYRPQSTQIYLEDAPLTPQQQQQQAQDTVASIVQDFNQDPAVEQFNEELQEASQGEVKDLADLSTQNLAQIIEKNPQIQGVVQKHLKNQDFAAAIEEIFSNPQFQQSVKKLQQPNTPPNNTAH